MELESETEPTFEFEITESVHDTLRQSDNPDAVWLWCIFCERFFQARHLRIDYLNNREGCAFCDCAGLDCAVFRWDTFREADDPQWPASEGELCHGLPLGASSPRRRPDPADPDTAPPPHPFRPSRPKPA